MSTAYAAAEEDQDLLLHLHRHRRPRVRAGRRPGAAQPAARGHLRLQRVHARVDALVDGARLARRDPDRRADLRPAVPARPRRVVRLAGAFIIAYGVLHARRGADAGAGVAADRRRRSPARAPASAFVSVGPIVGAVAPYRMRTQAFALVPVFIFLMGGFFGGLLAGALSDAHGERTALTIVAPIAGDDRRAALHVRLALPEARHLARGRGAARGAVGDPAHERAPGRDPGAAGPQPRLQLRARPGAVRRRPRGARAARCWRCSGRTAPASRRCCARSAGSASPIGASCGSTAARSPTSTPRSGSGRASCSCAAVPACSPSSASARTCTRRCSRRRSAGSSARRGSTGVLDALPRARRTRRSVLARELSGGQQQMLALAMALVHEPEILLIDELSLGLAPLVVEELLGVVAGPEGARADDDRRRAVAERRAGRSPTAPSSWRRAGSASRARRRSWPSATTSSAPSSSAARAAERVLGLVVTQQALFYGVVFGLIYAVFAAGFVLVYRSHRRPELRPGRDRRLRRRALRPVPRAVRRPVLARVRARGRRRPRSSGW